jgi:Flp pilus assembly protein TadD
MNRKMRRAENREIGRYNRLAARPGQNQAKLPSISNIVILRFSQAVRCQQSGQLVEAIALYDRILSLSPDIAEVHSNRGAALAGLERFGDAEAAYRRAIALKPDFADAYNNLGNVLCEIGRLDEAERALRQAIKLKPEWSQYHTSLGIVLKSQDKLGDAEAAHRKAINLDPGLPAAHCNLGETLWRLGRLDEAKKALRQAVTLNAHYAEAFANLAAVLNAQGRPNEAEIACLQAIALRPHFAQAYNNLGNILFNLGRLDDAEKALRRAITLRPQLAEAVANLGNTLRAQGRLFEAEAVLRQAIALTPNRAEIYYNLGNVLGDQDQLIEAETAYRRAITLKPNFADAHNNLGATLKYLGRFTDARRSVERALQLMPQNVSYFLNLSELKHFGTEDSDLAAMQDFARNIEALSVKQQIDLHFALAKAYEDVGRYDDTIQQLLAGNALKRRQIPYDEAAAIGTLERIEKVFTPELMQTFQDTGEPSSAPLFIVGMPRSGTTLIEQILASHPQVFAGGELQDLNIVAANIDPTASCTLPFPEVMPHLSGAHLQRLGARYIAEITRRAPNAVHVTDKLPSNFRFAGLIHLALPNARIIHVVRDPVDTCMSCFSKLFANSQYQTYDLAELGRYYRRYQTLMEHWHRVLPPGRILDVLYEDVIADLEGQSRRIVDHCGLEWDARCLTFHETERPVHTASAVQVRQPIYRSAIGRAQLYKPFLQPLLAELSGAA